jgi:HPt (histidine-containing phosphotransfer) domain-containing protein
VIPVSVEPGVEEPDINVQQLEALVHEFSDAAGVFDQLVGLFVSGAVKQLEAMRGAVSAGDERSLAQAAHGLKGSSLNVGARGMASICLELEARTGPITPTRARALLDRLDREFALVRAVLERYRSPR